MYIMASRFLSSLTALLLLAACGFTPLYGGGAAGGTGSSAASASGGLDAVEIALIPDADGVYLRNALIDRFYTGGYPADPRYRLDIAWIETTRSDYDLTEDAEATRRQIRLATTMTLTDTESGEVVLTRSLNAVNSYNVLGSQFTTRVSEADAREAALTDLARQVETQTALFLGRS